MPPLVRSTSQRTTTPRCRIFADNPPARARHSKESGGGRQRRPHRKAHRSPAQSRNGPAHPFNDARAPFWETASRTAAGWPELMRLGERLAFPLPDRSKTVGDRDLHGPQLPNRRSVGIGTYTWKGKLVVRILPARRCPGWRRAPGPPAEHCPVQGSMFALRPRIGGFDNLCR